jgi:hypothetical protein
MNIINTIFFNIRKSVKQWTTELQTVHSFRNMLLSANVTTVNKIKIQHKTKKKYLNKVLLVFSRMYQLSLCLVLFMFSTRVCLCSPYFFLFRRLPSSTSHETRTYKNIRGLSRIQASARIPSAVTLNPWLLGPLQVVLLTIKQHDNSFHLLMS